jgi:hypothetical protein
MMKNPRTPARPLCVMATALVAANMCSHSFAQSTATYAYDALGRLTTISYPVSGGNKTIAFAYDATGNRTSVASTVPSGTGNDLPIAANDKYVTIPQVPTDMNVLWNDREPNQQALTLSLNSGPSKGTASVVGTKFVYTANAGATGQDSFGYTVTDSAGGTATATVTVDISELNPIWADASSNYGGGFTGLTGTGMRDARFGSGSPPPMPATTTHGTNTGAAEYIYLDLGSA